MPEPAKVAKKQKANVTPEQYQFIRPDLSIYHLEAGGKILSGPH